VVLGVRPEEIRSSGGAPDLDGSAVRCRVDLVELLGGEVLIHASRNGSELTARTSSGPVPQVGDEVTLVAPPNSVHLFDAETGKRLTP
jgi:ABC-type sugar transport system ATPase subunit